MHRRLASLCGQAEAKWKKKAGIDSTTHVRASLERQPETIRFLEESFRIDLRALAK